MHLSLLFEPTSLPLSTQLTLRLILHTVARMNSFKKQTTTLIMIFCLILNGFLFLLEWKEPSFTQLISFFSVQSLVTSASSSALSAHPCPHWTWSLFSSLMYSDGLQDMLPKIWYLGILNILSWRSLSKQQKQEGLSDLPPCFSPEADHKPLMWEVPSLYPWERNILVSKMEGQWEESKWTGLVFPSLPHLAHALCPIISFYSFPLKPRTKTFRFNHFFGSSFPYEEGSHVT